MLFPLGAEETRETFAGLETWQIVLWYGLIGRLGRDLLLRRRPARPQVPPRPRQDADRKAARARDARRPRSSPRTRGSAGATRWRASGTCSSSTASSSSSSGPASSPSRTTSPSPSSGWVFWQGWFYLGYSLFLDVFGFALIVGLSVFAVKSGILRPFRLSYWRPAEPARAARGRGAGATGSATGSSSAACSSSPSPASCSSPSASRRTTRPSRSGRRSAGSSARRSSAIGLRRRGGRVGPCGYLVGARRRSRSSGSSLDPVHEGGAHARRPGRGGREGRARRQHAARRSPPTRSPRRSATRPSTRSRPSTCSTSTRARSAASATPPVPRLRPGYPLSPRDLVLDLREVAEGSMGNRAALGIPPRFPDARRHPRRPIKPETLWSCMQCMACVEICPVGIEHVPIINHMRRALIERGEMDGAAPADAGDDLHLRQLLRRGQAQARPLDARPRLRRQGHSQGAGRAALVRRRLRVVRPAQPEGDAGARPHPAPAGVDFGILYDGERTAGNDVRRTGEEGLWTSLAEENVAAIGECRFDRILTSDPHTFNTLKNEYPQLGGNWERRAPLAAAARAARGRPARAAQGPRLPGHLPRPLHARPLQRRLRRAPRGPDRAVGCELVEMPRNRDNSFCCGAGGGRIWMKELKAEDAPRPSESRIDEAVALGAIDYFVVACPKDVTMYEDAIKTSGHQGEIELREMSELALRVARAAVVPSEGRRVEASAMGGPSRAWPRARSGAGDRRVLRVGLPV